MAGIRVLSLFDGIGTGMVALKDNGIKVEKYFASEIDKKAMDIAKKNHSDIIQIGDVNSVDVDVLGDIDLIIGGSPCQGFSRNGKHLNFDDKRSVLFLRFAEILEEVQKRNKDVRFMMENVRMKKEWQEDGRIHITSSEKGKGGMNVAEIRNTAKPDVKKVFGAIAIIISRRGEGKVRLVGVRKVSEGVRKAG